MPAGVDLKSNVSSNKLLSQTSSTTQNSLLTKPSLLTSSCLGGTTNKAAGNINLQTSQLSSNLSTTSKLLTQAAPLTSSYKPTSTALHQLSTTVTLPSTRVKTDVHLVPKTSLFTTSDHANKKILLHTTTPKLTSTLTKPLGSFNTTATVTAPTASLSLTSGHLLKGSNLQSQLTSTTTSTIKVKKVKKQLQIESNEKSIDNKKFSIQSGNNVSLLEAMDLEGLQFLHENDKNAGLQLPPVTFDAFRRKAILKETVENFSSEQKGKKLLFINFVSGILLKNPKFTSQKDEDRNELKRLVEEIIKFDPEFILKVALYARKELNIRTCSNFLLALASLHESCRPYLKKYFNHSINLPSDWLETAELFCALEEKEVRAGVLPSALRKVMVTKFPEFDEYQLAKYNKEKSRLAKGKANAAEDKDKNKNKNDKRKPKKIEEVDEEAEITEQQCFTLKRLIRQLHISEPVNAVLSLLGKRYPDDPAKFYQLRLPGVWDSERAGKRMRLPIPETWETQISLHGNKAHVWESLIDNRKLPYMAMLRNLRNMIKSGISTKHHHIILKKICDEGAVLHSKQLPIRFFSAYKVLEDLEKELPKDNDEEGGGGGMDAKINEWTEELKLLKKRCRTLGGRLVSGNNAGGRGSARSSSSRGARGSRGGSRGGRGGRGGGGRSASEDPKATELAEVQANIGKMKKKIKQAQEAGDISTRYDPDLLKDYRDALDKAVIVATKYNLPPIRGRTLLINEHSSTKYQLSSLSAINNKGPLPYYVLSLMCQYACENVDFYLYSNQKLIRVPQTSLNDGVLHNIGSILKIDADEYGMEDGYSSEDFWQRVYETADKYDNIIAFGNVNLSEGFCSAYREKINPRALIVNIGAFNATYIDSPDRAIVHIKGVSDQILRFIAERGDCALLQRVDDVDIRFGLHQIISPSNKPSATISIDPQILSQLKAPPSRKRIQTFRVFISSTFRDMHGERDLITRLIMPNLRRQLQSYMVDIFDIDLRWGVPEEASISTKETLIRCLRQARDAHLFVGMMGQRLGWVPSNDDLASLPDDVKSLIPKSYRGQFSLTMLEAFAFLSDSSSEDRALHAFVYFRDSNLLNDVPSSVLKDFSSENEASTRLIQTFKETISAKGVCLYDNYPANWAGVINSKPVVNGLDDFSNHLFNSLLHRIKQDVESSEESLTTATTGGDEGVGLIGGDSALQKIATFMNELQIKLSENCIGRDDLLGSMEDVLKKDFLIHLTRLARKHALSTTQTKSNNNNSSTNKSAGKEAVKVLKLNIDPIGGILMLHGHANCGKSVLVAGLVKRLLNNLSLNDNHKVICHYVNPTSLPDSGRLSFILRHIIYSAISLQTQEPDEIASFIPIAARLFASLDIEEEATACEIVIPIFHDFLSMFPYNLTILIDGLDEADKNSNVSSLHWLPHTLPKNVTIILTALTKGPFYSTIEKGREDCVQFEIVPLNPNDRANIVRTLLQKHGKELVEKGLNNQMRVITMKKASNSPFYLRLVAEEVRLHGVYENLDDKLRKLPQSTNDLIAHILHSIQTECGTELCNAVLFILVNSRHGITYNDLRVLVSVLLNVFAIENASKKSSKTNQNLAIIHLSVENWHSLPSLISEVQLDYLLEHLNCFMQPTNEQDHKIMTYQFANEEIRSVCRTVVAQTLDLEIMIHDVLSAYYSFVIFGSVHFTTCKTLVCGPNTNVITALPFHLFQSCQWQRFLSLMTNLDFVKLCIDNSLTHELLLSYAGWPLKRKMDEREWVQVSSNVHFMEFYSFLKKHGGFLSKNPWLVLQQVLSESPQSSLYIQGSRMMQEQQSVALPCLTVRCLPEEVNKTFSPPHLVTTLHMNDTNGSAAGGTVAVTCLALSPGLGSHLACGLINGSVRLFDSATFKLLRTLLGHTDAITSLCFLDQSGGSLASNGPVKLALCTGSRDEHVFVWDVEIGHRLYVLDGHRRAVSGIATDWLTKCQYIATAGLDGQLRLWQTRNIRGVHKEWRLDRPLNCIDFHPNGDRLVVGSWDKTLKIYSISFLKRIAVIRGHNSAVQAVKFAPHNNGEHLVSAGMFGEVILWHTNTGNLLGFLRPMQDGFMRIPITSLAFLPNRGAPQLLAADANGHLIILGANLGVLQVELSTNNLLGGDKVNNNNKQLSSSVHGNTGDVISHQNDLSATCLALIQLKSSSYVAIGTRGGFVWVYLAEEPWKLICKLNLSKNVSHPEAIDGLVWWKCTTRNERLLLCVVGGRFLTFLFKSSSGELQSVDIANSDLPISDNHSDHVLHVAGLSSSNACVVAGGMESSCSIWIQALFCCGGTNNTTGQTRSVRMNKAGGGAYRASAQPLVLNNNEGPVAGLDFISYRKRENNNSNFLSWLATASHDMSVCVYSVCLNESNYHITATLKLHHKQAHPDWLTCVKWRKNANDNKDNEYELLTGSVDQSIILWQFNTKSKIENNDQLKLIVQMQGHSSSITDVAFNRGCIASCSVDGEARLWSRQGQLVSVIHPKPKGKQQQQSTTIGLSACLLLIGKDNVDEDVGDVDDDEEETQEGGYEITKFKKPTTQKAAEEPQKRFKNWDIDDEGNDRSQDVVSPTTVGKKSTNNKEQQQRANFSAINSRVSDTQLWTASLAGHVRVHNPLTAFSSFDEKVHSNNITSISTAVASTDADKVCFTSGCLDGTCKYWSFKPIVEKCLVENVEGEELKRKGPSILTGGVRQLSQAFFINKQQYVLVAGQTNKLSLCQIIHGNDEDDGDGDDNKPQQLQHIQWIVLPNYSIQENEEDSSSSVWVSQLLLWQPTSEKIEIPDILVVTAAATYRVYNLDKIFIGGKPNVRQIIKIPRGNGLLQRLSLTSESRSKFKQHFRLELLIDNDKADHLWHNNKLIDSTIQNISQIREQFESNLRDLFNIHFVCKIVNDDEGDESTFIGLDSNGNLHLCQPNLQALLTFENVFIPSRHPQLYVPLKETCNGMLLACDNGEGILQFVLCKPNPGGADLVNELSNIKHYKCKDITPVGLYQFNVATTSLISLNVCNVQTKHSFLVGDSVGHLRVLHCELKL